MDLTISRLIDVYGSLLTEHKREVAKLYYHFDLSLQEIAEEKGCSRQSISDTLSSVREKLLYFESSLHLLELLNERAREREALLEFSKALPGEQRAALLHILGEPSEAQAGQ